MPTIQPFGTWDSPITAAAMVKSSVGLTGVGAWRGRACWLESRPSERGRVVLVAEGEGGAAAVELTPAEHSMRSRVHEYGGGAVAVRGGDACYVNLADQRLWRLYAPGESTPLTADSGADAAIRFADMHHDPVRPRVACVREDQRGDGEPANAIVLVGLDGSDNGGFGIVVDDRHDFVATPRFSPDGTRLCWLGWDHPNMPWDGTTLWCAAVDADGRVGPPERIAGGRDESVFQPEWAPDGGLLYVSDRSGWWNLYRHEPQGADPLCPLPADCGLPLWQFGMRSFAVLADSTIVLSVIRDGVARLHRVTGGGAEPLALPFGSSGAPIATEAGLLLSAGSADAASVLALASPDLRSHRVLKAASTMRVDPGIVSRAEPISFPSEGGATAHGFYYPPANPAFAAPEGELPPLMVRSHGGPTGATSSDYSLAIQYWTSRGFAVLDVNYRGSTGYGRAYRDALKGQWGVADVADCAAGALYLAERGLADRARLIIRGGSAGGYTTLCALAFTDVFRAGASLYGVGDLKALAEDTHKFESRYLDALIGPLPDAEALYHARSPVAHADRLNCPVIFLQGLEDKVVPPNQAEAMVEALRAKGVPVAYIAFAGEQHGFRQAANIRRAIEAELYFYGRVFGFAPADAIEPMPIDNLDPAPRPM